MPLPGFNRDGDLPEGLHIATLQEVVERFGQEGATRRERTAMLRRIHERVAATRKLQRFVLFGSYVTAKPEPRDIDLVLVMADDFSPSGYDEETQVVFDHPLAESGLGASVFWLSPSILLRGSLEAFLLGWGTKRDQTRRGIVEVIS